MSKSELRPGFFSATRRSLLGSALVGGAAALALPSRSEAVSVGHPGTFSVRSFGAVGNGVADDTAAARAAVTAAFQNPGRGCRLLSGRQLPRHVVLGGSNYACTGNVFARNRAASSFSGTATVVNNNLGV